MSLPSPSPESVVVVTGAASGIGAALVAEFTRGGYGVIAVDIDEERLADVAANAAPAGTPVVTIGCDLADAQQRRALIERIAEDPRHLVGFCNNAGLYTTGRFHELPYERESRVMAVNAVAPHELTSAVLPGMVERGEGAILNTASIGANCPLPLATSYGATKAFLHSFSQALHVELSGTGVSCTSLQPGPTLTKLVTDTVSNQDRLARARRSRFSSAEDFLFLFREPAFVARAAVRAMRRGDRTVVTGPKSRFLFAPTMRYAPHGLFLPVVREGVTRILH
ncbi:SDR family NAD(P)-dependent oxidoreductase [Nocardia sp. NPDC051030]|uniref:SDR family NAD(P)-dependent oxidoreductase n=1 Tax=Nocardia sp. NPDC051030 TaxID=3155162 RepID=UPI00342A7A3E